MVQDPNIRCHSARVHMELHLSGSALAISHLGPDFFILAEPIDHPPAQAEIVMSVDGRETRWWVSLPMGLSAATRRTSISPCPAANEPKVG